MSCVGGLAEKAIEGLCIDKAFLGCNSISIESGVTTPNLYESQVKQSVLKSSRETILITDSSKFGHTSMARICPIKDLNRIITDKNLPRHVGEEIKNMGIALDIV